MFSFPILIVGFMLSGTMKWPEEATESVPEPCRCGSLIIA
ncbi:hypothetical protein ATPR_2879 [Acetobacter tropicalis NBRC 101654]|uniref:Uncharacterized protein n=1 Tax=Acetobacter tropicalis NBRC 101654 TaxID=749388 RepID=F7VHN0_9PROT|nr:hypothetical protein ATPR_2879 [Acetobacter tropicalis NBRC 101654]